ncbi:hypothetical protein BLS_003652 [Venturia inaequalis]|uniref:tRNA (guanine(10)-N(2))-methyltransferase n=1 Tax=Venturia inaequalis TaxID=5025 RepID=A0A8H3YVC6_VENIN|nr:hypothetical protein BLS_003652 [Venturia inaequalis]KAE9989064.1 hypothetical protein EG327_003118 [Venturia inaequalis]RDI85694.1 hypothetical protein Vi05172_g4390 [Venturia inaequalis]
MDYLIRLIQIHETFRKPELEALAEVANIKLEFVFYSADSPYCIVRLESERAARKLISRSVLGDAIYELWGQGTDYPSLHANIRSRTQSWWPKYEDSSFKFKIRGYQGSVDLKSQRTLIESFSFMGFKGPIRMKDPDNEFCVLEDYERYAEKPYQLYFGRLIAEGGRTAMVKYDLKKRKYISTTSMDSELALITANITKAAPGKLFYDPFVGTGSFPIACSHYGATTLGSDIDGRSVRGTTDRNIVTNFTQYNLTNWWLDSFVSDLTNTPLRLTRCLDGIICDPPYGVREGLKVLGRKQGDGLEAVMIDGVPAHLRPGFIAPKKAYSFDLMLDDILDFAVITLVDGGRLSMWMPTANDEDIEHAIPQHQALKLVACCIQHFNKWSRRLLTYVRLSDEEVGELKPRVRKEVVGRKADELNNFRRKYFEGFQEVGNGAERPNA